MPKLSDNLPLDRNFYEARDFFVASLKAFDMTMLFECQKNPKFNMKHFWANSRRSFNILWDSKLGQRYVCVRSVKFACELLYKSTEKIQFLITFLIELASCWSWRLDKMRVSAVLFAFILAITLFVSGSCKFCCFKKNCNKLFSYKSCWGKIKTESRPTTTTIEGESRPTSTSTEGCEEKLKKNVQPPGSNNKTHFYKITSWTLKNSIFTKFVLNF